MEVEVANGSWRHGLVLSVKIGEVLREAPLRGDTRLTFPHELADVKLMQVGVFSVDATTQARQALGSDFVPMSADKNAYEVNIRDLGPGTPHLVLRVRAAADATATTKKKLDDAVATDGYIEQHDLRAFATGVELDSRPYSGNDRSDISKETEQAVREDRINMVRQMSSDYVEKYDLRQVLQTMFQRVIRDRPENPFRFMQEYLSSQAGADAGTDASSFAEQQRIKQEAEQQRVERERQWEAVINALRAQNAAQQKEIETLKRQGRSDTLSQAPSVPEANGHFSCASSEILNSAPDPQATARIEVATQEVETLLVREEMERKMQQRLDDLRSELERDHARKLDEQRAKLEQQLQTKQNMETRHGAQQSEMEQRHGRQLDAQRSEMEQRHAKEIERCRAECEQKFAQEKLQYLENSGKSAAADRVALERAHAQHISTLQAQIETLSRQLQAPSATERWGGDTAAGGKVASLHADAAAGGAREDANTVALSQANALDPPGTASTVFPQSQTPLHPPGTADTAISAGGLGATSVGQMQMQMFSQLLASTYAPPVPPTLYLENREDSTAPSLGPNAEVLVEVYDCKDAMTNGTFAWVGTCNSRPLYRLLGTEPRYLFYAEADIASGWRIVDKMGSDNCVERLGAPKDAQLPTFCEKGDFGGSVREAMLTGEILQRISMIASLDEKAAIRGKLSEQYGESLTKLEGAQRGLISKASPVVAIAHALEAQQRAIQLLHSQLAAESHRREAAEQHACTMEEAFETLQLRIQAQLPGPPNVGVLQDLQASMMIQQNLHGQVPISPPGPLADEQAAKLAEAQTSAPAVQDRALVFEQDGKADWAPDIGKGCGPVPRAPVAPKDRKPAEAPTFRKAPRGLRNGGVGGPIPPSPSGQTPPPDPEKPLQNTATAGAVAAAPAA